MICMYSSNFPEEDKDRRDLMAQFVYLYVGKWDP